MTLGRILSISLLVALLPAAGPLRAIQNPSAPATPSNGQGVSTQRPTPTSEPDNAQRTTENPGDATRPIAADSEPPLPESVRRTLAAAALSSQTVPAAAQVLGPAPARPATSTSAPQPVPPTAGPGQSLGSDPPQDLGTIQAVVGDGLTVTWPQSSVRVALADDTLASIRVVSSDEIVVNGLKQGRTSLFVWFADGRRVFYRLVVSLNFEVARAALRALSPTLTVTPGADQNSVILGGDVPDEAAAAQARTLAEQLLPRVGTPPAPPRIVNLVRYPGGMGTIDDRLNAAMAAIDPRIRARRIQIGVNADVALDSYVLEGQVRDVNALVQAVVLVDRQLGGTGKTVKAADADRVLFQRSSSSGLSGIGGGGAGGMGLQALQQTAPPKSGLSAQLARGLLVTSESGKVVSFLRVDSLPQVLVGIRVLEINRGKARQMGIDFRFDRDNFGVGSSVIPGGGTLPDARVSTNNRNTGNVLPAYGNVVGTFVRDTFGISAALDLLSEKNAARSIAEPNILTLSGEQASVLVGGEVPIPGTFSTQVSVQTGFNFQGFGVRLDIRPTLDDAGIVTLEVAPSIVTPSATLGNSSVPGFQIQRVETTARVQAGQSLILGGLLTSNDAVESRGIPLLQKIPIFRRQRRSSNNTELLFVITPRVIDPPSVDVRLPPLEFRNSPNRLGASGLDEKGVPFTFQGMQATVLGKSGVCLEVREAPNDDSAALAGCLLPKTEVVVVGTADAGGWLRIHAPSGEEGWVLRSRLRLATEKP